MPPVGCSVVTSKSTCLEPEFFCSLQSHPPCFCTAYPNSVHGDTILLVRTGTRVKQVCCLSMEFNSFRVLCKCPHCFCRTLKMSASLNFISSTPPSPYPRPTLPGLICSSQKPQQHPVCLCFSDTHVPSVRKTCWLCLQKERVMP